jgi:Transcriptional antiterminator
MLNEDGYKQMKFYSGILNISLRTLYSDINAIDCFINEFDMAVDRKPGLGVKLLGSPENKIGLLQSLKFDNEIETVFTPKERQLEILRLLLVEEKTLTYEKLSNYFLVSKTSIAKDIEEIGFLLNPETVSIESDKKGTRIIGTEAQKLYSLKKFINILLEEKKCLNDEDFFRIAPEVLKKVFPSEIVDISFKIVAHTEDTINVSLSDYYLKSLIVTLIAFIHRLFKGSHMTSERNFVFEEIKTLETYLIAKNISELVSEQLHISFDENDIEYLNRQLIAHGIKPELKNKMETAKYKEIIFDAIKEMGTIMHVDLTKDKRLYQGLVFHIVPMVYRLKMGVKVKNPLLNEIKEQYPVTLSAAWYVMSKLKNELGVTLTEDEVAFIMVHFQAAIDRNVQAKKILIVCPTGIGTSELIANKIKRILPSQDIIEVVPMRKAYENNIDNVDLIISSVQLNIKKKPVIYISALVSNTDLKNISNFYTNIFYGDNSIEDEAVKYHFEYIPEILDKDLIFAGCDFKTKEECLSKMIDAMEKKHETFDGFGDSILEREKLGATALDSGVAIPHALPETVKNSKLVIMTLNSPIRWDNKHVNTIILICIANKDIKKVKSILSEIYKIVESKDSINHLLTGKKNREIFELLGGTQDDKQRVNSIGF